MKRGLWRAAGLPGLTLLALALPGLTQLSLALAATPAVPKATLTRVTSGGCCGGTAWTPDSRSLLYIDRPPGAARAAVYSVPAAGGVAPGVRFSRVAFYSPDLRYAAVPQGASTQVERLSGTRADISREGQQVPPPLSLMFAMKKGTAKIIQAGGNRGWFVVYLTDVVKGDASGNADMLRARKQELSSILQQEYASQMVVSASKDAGVEKNKDGIEELRTRLTSRESN